ncbi:MAG: FAD binding domain-containing protein [Candidatus Bathyarchaeia archaeon]|jgi:carbon-monoxide dehydrogenase medium subunit
MPFHPTDYFEPTTPEEVCGLLSQYGKHAKVIAGGTAIYELAKRDLASEVKQLVSLRKVPLKYVRRDEQGLHVGATTPLAELAGSSEVNSDPLLQVLAEALREIRPMQVRAVATVGGEICTSLPLLDLPPALLALDTVAIIQGESRQRAIALNEFLVDFFLNALNRSEFLVEALIPKQPEHSGSAFLKFGRTAYDFNLINVATRLTLAKDGTCSDTRIILGGVGRVPLRAAASENEIKGRRIDDQTVARAAEALGEFKAIPQIHGDAGYKRDIARVLVRDCVKRAAERTLVVAH